MPDTIFQIHLIPYKCSRHAGNINLLYPFPMFFDHRYAKICSCFPKLQHNPKRVEEYAFGNMSLSLARLKSHRTLTHSHVIHLTPGVKYSWFL